MAPSIFRSTNLQYDMDDGSYDVTLSAQVQPPSTSVTENIIEQQYARALAESREEFNNNLGKRQSQQKNDQDRISLSFSNVFTPLSAPDSDTLIYIGPPPRAPGQSRADYQYIEQHFSTLYRMHSQALKDLGSPAFERLLGPRSERTRRRFGKEGLLSGVKTEGIEYYIDLRPAEEGDEAVELITDLTCTQGVLNWHKAEKKYSISPTLICGRDDFRSPLDQFRDAEARTTDDRNVNETPCEPEAEYSALRHRSAIERVLQAIGHNDPKLDSAPKMWTYFQVAEHLDVAKHERISGWITKWLYLHPNSNFIQNNPEVVYRIGMGTMSVNMICDAYSMLAGEKALLDTSDPSLRLHLKTSVHGRPLEILDDDERNRIDHAAASLHARIKSRFEHLVDENMNWLKQSKFYSEVLSIKPRTEEDKQAIITTERMIKDYVRGRILWAVARNSLSDHPEFDQAMANCRDFREGLPMCFNEVYRTLNKAQRLLTRSLWITLHAEKLEQGEINTWTPAKGLTGVLYHTYGNCPIGDEMVAREDCEPGTGVRRILHNDLDKKIDNLNKISARHFAEDQYVDHTVMEERAYYQNVQSSLREKSSKKLSTQIESSTTQGKHDLIDIESEDDAPLEMTNIPRARSGSEKRRRLSADHTTLVSTDSHPLTTTLSLRVRNPDLTDAEIAASKAEHDVREAEQLEHLTPLLDDYSTPEQVYSENAKIYGATKLAFDTHASSIAEHIRATSWRSYEGDVYMRAEPNYLVEQDAVIPDTESIWVATPEPFRRSETTKIDSKSWREVIGLRDYWRSGNKMQPHIGKEYWRATTCQLYCKLPDGSVSLVHEIFPATPTLAEASSRNHNDKQLNSYIQAYNAYARHLAEVLVLPYWTALNGDMYLRNPPITTSANNNIWARASNVFDAEIKDTRYENSVKVEYWRSPAGYLFRRRTGRIELYTEAKEESAPPNSASILAPPLKIFTKQGVQKIAPHARFLDTQYFDAKHSMQPQSPVQRYTPIQRSPLNTEPVTYGYTCIQLQKMLIQFSDILGKYCEDILHPPHIYHGADPIPRDLMDTLMCLNDDEWKYLPLWAGGCDDGTGGVFDEVDVPNLEAGGFAGGKRGLGSDTVDGKGESEGWSEVGSDAVSTLGKASKLATDGTETVKSFDSASEFMRQDELWEQIRNMKDGEDKLVQTQVDAQDEDQVTVMGAASDIQGELFGDIDDDNEVEAMGQDEDDGFEFVDDSDDGFVPVAKD